VARIKSELTKNDNSSSMIIIMYRYSPELRASIGKYASSNGVRAAAVVHSHKVGEKISETTVRSLRDAYREEVARKRRANVSDVNISKMPKKKQGRPLLLDQQIDIMVQEYLRKVREGGGMVTARIAMAAATGIMAAYDKSQLAQHGGHIEITRPWAYSILNRMGFVQRKCSTAKSRETTAHFQNLKRSFLNELRVTVTMENIPPSLILNWDQTGIKMVPSSLWTMEKRGAKRVEVIGATDKRQITAVFCCSLVGDFLPIQLIYGGKTKRCHPKFEFPLDWNITHSPRHWSNEETMLEYIEIIIPYVQNIREGSGEAALVLMDNFKGQITKKVTGLLLENDIHYCLLPPNTTDKLQPLDISVNKPAKQFLRKKFDEWYAHQIVQQVQENTEMNDVELSPICLSLPILKELGAKWLVEMAEYISDNPQFITNGFRKAGIPQAIDGDDEDQSDEGSDAESLDESHDSNESYEDMSSYYDTDPEVITIESD
jgi:hypothetical protein